MIVKAENNADTTIVESGSFAIELFKQFDVTLDYFYEKVCFVPNENFEGERIR